MCAGPARTTVFSTSAPAYLHRYLSLPPDPLIPTALFPLSPVSSSLITSQCASLHHHQHLELSEVSRLLAEPFPLLSSQWPVTSASLPP
jgi:hypothetical protein